MKNFEILIIFYFWGFFLIFYYFINMVPYLIRFHICNDQEGNICAI